MSLFRHIPPESPDPLKRVAPGSEKKRVAPGSEKKRVAPEMTDSLKRVTPETPLTVTQVTALIKETLADHVPAPVAVVGEISNFSERGHWYLTLKDEQNVLNAVMWSSSARSVRFKPEQGLAVVATGRLDYYGPQGRLQMYIDTLEPVGAGALELRLRQLCEELRKLGYFDPARKKPIPAFPQRVAVVTSEKGAALADVIRTARQRWAGIKLFVIDVRVQGAEAAPEIAEALDALSKHHQQWGIEVVILTRGGGSIEDLWAFNERNVADAIYRAKLPIVAAIGHEVDTTIAELVADLRCSTPTQAAERLVPDARAERQHLEQLATRLRTALRKHVQQSRAVLTGVGRHEFFRRPVWRVEQLQRKVGEQVRRLARAMALRQEASASQWAALERQLGAVGPMNVLKRGYTYTMNERGALLRSAAEVKVGSKLVTQFHDGGVRSVVEEKADRSR